MTHNLNSRKLFVTLLLVVFTIISSQAKKYNLKLNLKKGETYQQVSKANSNILQEFGGQKINMKMNITGVTSYKVLAVNSNEYDIEARMTQMDFVMEVANRKMAFSSTKADSSDVFSSILKMMTNKPFNIKMTKYGKVTKITNLSELWDGVIDQFPQLNAMQKIQMKEQINNAYGDKAFRGNIELATAIYPNHKVRKEDKWTIDTKLQAGLSADIQTEYQLSEINSKQAVIVGKGKVSTSVNSSSIEKNGMKMQFDLSGATDAKIKIDRKSGWIIEATTTQDIKGEAKVESTPQLPNGMSIPMEFKTTSTITNK
ncbi:hypothetical protein EMN47_02685 [Prolixibacteraceae bacterium JC049]|nr:hypothetical protein [Prolixibacteraceae bacterium JC049]